MKNIEKKTKLLKKAYEIDLSRIDEGYLWSEKYCYANSIGKAKKLLLAEIRYDDMVHNVTGKEITFLNIPVRRMKSMDLYEFEGAELKLHEIIDKLNRRKRHADLDEILNDKNISHCYIMKRGTYYAPNCCGYVSRSTEAGVYEKADAVQQAKSCDELTLVPINNEEHNRRIRESVSSFESRIII